jgi:hypothetical protein
VKARERKRLPCRERQESCLAGPAQASSNRTQAHFIRRQPGALACVTQPGHTRASYGARARVHARTRPRCTQCGVWSVVMHTIVGFGPVLEHLRGRRHSEQLLPHVQLKGVNHLCEAVIKSGAGRWAAGGQTADRQRGRCCKRAARRLCGQYRGSGLRPLAGCVSASAIRGRARLAPCRQEKSRRGQISSLSKTM